MARSSSSVDRLLEETLRPVIQQASAAIAALIANAVAARLEARLPKLAPGARPARAAAASRSRKDLSRWVADRRARRVPNFVIELTGLRTKKEIVARYGGGAAFEKGKNLPKLVTRTAPEDAAPKAKPPIIRKKRAVA
ncbi:hypothetical protein [Anaeromyxobacter oryzae]|uniref:Uncharacterized protein n=1 Tax=Anaeromyxobacter oryzae TaxID=2918170 RepID=A0ABM7X017_9BACT|nr:hypothetical protein [Anaeromyxobacter oryzae]BDG05129.1 hypothetical protein AMOR_41250 [Anaeromyxobacter oryzae]